MTAFPAVTLRLPGLWVRPWNPEAADPVSATRVPLAAGADQRARRRWAHRWGVTILLLVTVLSACSSRAQPAAVGATQPGPDPRTAGVLVRIAQVFNTDYDHNNDGPVYDRWDARSQAVISRAEYIRRHAECSTAPQAPAHVENAAPGPHGAWLVHYEITGQQLTDYWFYIRRRWEFDLILSNPDAAQLYRLPFAKYAAQVGCQDH